MEVTVYGRLRSATSKKTVVVDFHRTDEDRSLANGVDVHVAVSTLGEVRLVDRQFALYLLGHVYHDLR
jgi:hypothetical protein